jgi:hypothetical protein
MVRYNKYVVQSFYDVSQFGSLDIARKHAMLNRPARIYSGDDVTLIQGNQVTVKCDTTHIEEHN